MVGIGGRTGTGTGGGAVVSSGGTTGCRIEDDGSGCVGESHEGESLPLDIYIMFDQSGSMCSCIEPEGGQLCPDPNCAATRLDAVVKGEKYLNVEKFPTITYKSDNVRFDGDRVVRVEGELTMLGVTRPVALDVQNFTCGAHPFNKKPMCGGQATATIKRSDFGMSAGLPYAPADEVRIVIPFEAYQADS